ncbi:MAG TPA: hypothetical protein VIM60_10915, partial [Edaphobacter sp.]
MPPESHTDDKPKPKLPRLASDWLRYLLGFSISVGVGLAPYLGLVGVPLFTPLLSLIPHSLQHIAIPISIASMGVIAVLVQWQRRSTPRPHEFRYALILSISTLLLFAAIEI